MTTLTEKAAAKINLTLRVVGRRPDGYHELESLVVFAGVADTLSLQPGSDAGLSITGRYAAVCGPDADNLVLKAEAALRVSAPGLKGGQFRLEKNLPVAAGIGGGSADAAAALRLLARTNGIPSDHPALAAAALATGADVPVCLDSEVRVMRGVGEILSAPVALPALPALLVNPGIPLSTSRRVHGIRRDAWRRNAASPCAGRGRSVVGLPQCARQRSYCAGGRLCTGGR